MSAEAVQSYGGGRVLIVALAVLMAVSLVMLFRPRQPSPFTAHGGFGAGHGTQSLMFGANPRAGAPRLH